MAAERPERSERRRRRRFDPSKIDDQLMERLYAEAADEDRALANMGMEDYARILAEMDK